MKFNHALRTDQSLALSASLGALFSGGTLSAVTFWRTRFAPAPTGYLHLGHVVNAIHVWGIARAYGGQVLLRVEDHDRTRCRAEYETALLDDLDWLGLNPDIGITQEFRSGRTQLRQSHNIAAYQAQLDILGANGLIYTCQCSRKEIARVMETASDGETRYPGTCAKLSLDESRAHSRRVRMNAECEHFDDVRLGAQSQCPNNQCGDFVARDRNGNFTYQFAVTVDDWQQDINFVIRGEDLLSSTGRQLQLARMLGRPVTPAFLHHQLIRRHDGIKLSKSLGDTGVREMRAAGLTSANVLGRAAYASGLVREPIPLAVAELRELFS